jgi:hypothetical protein
MVGLMLPAPRVRPLWALGAACLALGLPLQEAHGEELGAPPTATLASAERAAGWAVTVKGGVSLFTTSKSPAPSHLMKPGLRLEGTYRVGPRLEVGAEVGVLLTGEANYAFESASVVFRAPLYEGDVCVIRLGWGFGLGSGPPILSSDLRTSALIVPTMQASLGVRWKLAEDRFEIGFEVINEQLTVVTGVLTAGLRL